MILSSTERGSLAMCDSYSVLLPFNFLFVMRKSNRRMHLVLRMRTLMTGLKVVRMQSIPAHAGCNPQPDGSGMLLRQHSVILRIVYIPVCH